MKKEPTMHELLESAKGVRSEASKLTRLLDRLILRRRGLSEHLLKKPEPHKNRA